jgi:transposase
MEVSNKVRKLSNQPQVVSNETWKVCNKRGSEVSIESGHNLVSMFVLRKQTRRTENVQMSSRIDDALKQHLIKLVVEEGRKQIDVSREMDISVSSLRRWIREYRNKLQAEQNVEGYLTPTEQLKQQRALENEIQELREENEILKKAMHIFSKNPQ